VAAGARIVWSPHPNVLRVRIAALGPDLFAALDRKLAARALQAEAEAKTGAPWTDRTGNARSGLRGTSAVEGERGELVLSHAVFYGVYLELAHAGAWATVIPTMQRMGAHVRSDLAGLLGAA
jgi:hypothetical protein